METLIAIAIAIALMLPFTAAFLYHTNKVGIED